MVALFPCSNNNNPGFFGEGGGDKYTGFLVFCLQLNFVSVVKLFHVLVEFCWALA